MTQTVPATAVLGPGKTGLTIGLRVLNLDGTTYAAFATTGVAETSTAGTYRVAGGVVAPAAGGYIVWGTAGADLAEATIDAVPSVPSASDNATAAAAAILATPANKLAVDADGNAAVNAQAIRDAQKLAPSAGAAAAGSVDAHLDTIIGLTQANNASTSDSTAAGAITRRRGDSWSIPLTIGAVSGYTSLWFTIKRSPDDNDASSVVQVKKNASGLTDGLLYVNGATATDATNGTITVSDATTGAIVIALDETITDDLAPGEYSYDVQTLISGDVSTPDSGTFTITSDITRSVT